MKVKVSFNLEWEALNWYETICNSSTYGLKTGNQWPLGKIPKNVLNQISCENKAVALDKIKELLKKTVEEPENKNFMNAVMDAAITKWNAVESEYFDKLSKILDVDKDNFFDEYHAYFTFAVRSPFDYNTFMFSGFRKFVDSALHEIMHIEFLRKYTDYCKEKGLSNSQVGHLKEILTVLLNIDMIDLLSKPDEGYTDHQAMRQNISDLYVQNGGIEGKFVIFLDKAIGVVATGIS